MADIELYTFETASGEAGSYQTMNPQEAKEHGQKYGLKVIANQYIFDDSELVWDFTEKEDENEFKED